MRDKTKMKLFLGKITVTHLTGIEMNVARGGKTTSDTLSHCESCDGCKTIDNTLWISCVSGGVYTCI